MPFVNKVSKDIFRVIDYPDFSRLGGPHDGGYVVPLEAIRKSSCLLSFGVSKDWQFERDVQRINPEILISAYDHSVGSKTFFNMVAFAWMTALLRLLCFNFKEARKHIKRWLIAIDYFRFFKGNVRHIRKRVWYNTDRQSAAISEIIQGVGDSRDNKIFAKIDIEGSEYRILPGILDQADKFSGIVVEFHDIDICAETFNEIMKQLSDKFYTVHIHGNNYVDLNINHDLPNAMEITFIHKNLVSGVPKHYMGVFPRQGLDAPNNPDAEECKITF